MTEIISFNREYNNNNIKVSVIGQKQCIMTTYINK